MRSGGTLVIDSGSATRSPREDGGSVVSAALWVKAEVTITTPNTTPATKANARRIFPICMVSPFGKTLTSNYKVTVTAALTSAVNGC